MAAPRTAAIALARKLRALARSANKHEARLAQARAKEIIRRHKITEEELADRRIELVLDFSKDIWRKQIATAVIASRRCGLLVDGRGLVVAGFHVAVVEQVRQLYRHIVVDVDRLCAKNFEAYQKKASPSAADLLGIGFADDNAYGCGISWPTINGGLLEQLKQTTGGTKAAKAKAFASQRKVWFDAFRLVASDVISRQFCTAEERARAEIVAVAKAAKEKDDRSIAAMVENIKKLGQAAMGLHDRAVNSATCCTTAWVRIVRFYRGSVENRILPKFSLTTMHEKMRELAQLFVTFRPRVRPKRIAAESTIPKTPWEVSGQYARALDLD